MISVTLPETNRYIAPENRGPLESRRFRTWKAPFSGALAVSFREGILLKIIIPRSIQEVGRLYQSNDYPPRSLTGTAPEKLPDPNRKVVFQPPFFRVYVKLRGGRVLSKVIFWFISHRGEKEVRVEIGPNRSPLLPRCVHTFA